MSEEFDSEGRPARLPSGTRIRVRQVPYRGLLGTVQRQHVHYDGEERFWGNVTVFLDDYPAMLFRMHGWQVEKTP